MKFKTSDNLISLLVGQNLYSTADAALRELLQNADDACKLMQISDSSFQPEITIGYSISRNIFEVDDNGFGMDNEIFKESFATIGASKTESAKLRELLQLAAGTVRPIGQFGIGILSCFGVAREVDILTLAEGSTPISYKISDLRGEFADLDEKRTSRGTTVRLFLKDNGPMSAVDIPAAVSRYLRHASAIWLENTDDGQRQLVPEQWLVDSWDASSPLHFDMISQGHLQLSSAWDNINHGLDGQIALCNGGFLATENARDILPDYAIGFRGEIDVKPGSLTILLNREGFQKDESWSSFCQYVSEHYRTLVEKKLDDWLADTTYATASEDRKRAVQRAVLLILQTPLKDAVGEQNLEKARKLIPQALYTVQDVYPSIEHAFSMAQKNSPLYVHRTDDDQVINKSVTDRGQSIQLSAPIRSLNLRITLLRLNGFAVVQAERHRYSVHFGGRSRNIDVHDMHAFEELATIRGVSIALVKDAPAEHTRIGSTFQSREMTSIFGSSSDLKIQSVDTITDAVIADFSGYILNSQNPEIRKILSVIPDAVGNPIRKDLISAYLSLSIYEIEATRNILFELIVDSDFESKARQITGKLFHRYLSGKVAALLGKEEDQHE